MNSSVEGLAFQLADLSMRATLLLMIVLAARAVVRHPARRIVLGWSGFLGLALLAGLPVLPAWPQWNCGHWLARSSAVSTTDREVAADTRSPVAVDAAPESFAADRHSDGEASAVDPEEETSVNDARRSSFVEQLPASEPTRPEAVSPIDRLVLVDIGEEVGAITWICGALLGLGWVALGRWRSRRLYRLAQPAPEWAERELVAITSKSRCRPTLRISDRLSTAVAFGALRPAIILPACSVSAKNAAAVRAALAHEWAHIRHGDLWLLALERALLPVFAAHPLYWLLRRLTRADQELLADARAAGDNPVEYAQALLSWAQMATSSPRGAPLAALSMWSSTGNLSRRIEMILDPERPIVATTSHFWRATLFAGFVTVAAGVSFLTLRPQSTEAVMFSEGYQSSGTEPADESPSDEDWWDGLPVTRGSTHVAQSRATPRAANGEPRPQASATEPPRTALLPPAEAPEQALEQEILIQALDVQVDPAGLRKNGTSLNRLISDASIDGLTIENGITTAVLATSASSEELSRFLRQMADLTRVDILSRPQIRLLIGQTAKIQVGQADFGFQHSITPTLKPTESGTANVHLDTILELSRIAPTRPGEIESVARYWRHKVPLTADVELGKTLVWALPAPDDRLEATGDVRVNLIFITPRLLGRREMELPPPEAGRAPQIAPPAVRPAADDDLKSLRDVVRELKDEVRALRESRTPRDAGAGAADSAGDPRTGATESASRGGASPAGSPRRFPTPQELQAWDEQIQLKLLQLDIREAETELESASVAYEFARNLHTKGQLTETELISKRLVQEKARIALERVKIRLESPPRPPRK